MKSMIDIVLISRNLTKFVEKVDIQTLIAPDRNTILLSLSWPNENPRGPGFWKENENTRPNSRILYPQLREKYHYVNDQQLFWELIKVGMRSTTIPFPKGKAQTRKHEVEIKQQLDELDKIICNSQNLDNLDEILKQYDDLKRHSNINNAFQTKMWHSNLEQFRRVLVFDAEKVCVSERFWLMGRRKRSVQLSPPGTIHPISPKCTI